MSKAVPVTYVVQYGVNNTIVDVYDVISIRSEDGVITFIRGDERGNLLPPAVFGAESFISAEPRPLED